MVEKLISSNFYRDECKPGSFHDPVELGVVVAEPASRVQVVAGHQGPGQGHERWQTPTDGIVQPNKNISLL